MDITQSLKDAENSLRDYIFEVLFRNYTSNWLNNTGVDQEKIDEWLRRKKEEEKKIKSGTNEERLLYYAGFWDLQTILKKQWRLFEPALGKYKDFSHYFNILATYRNPDAHRRELFTHQKHLIIGSSGEIRNRITKYRSKEKTAVDTFPRFESIRDNIGNIWTPIEPMQLYTGKTLQMGDNLEFVVSAYDPQGREITYNFMTKPGVNTGWQVSNQFNITLNQNYICKNFEIYITIKSSKDYFANPKPDQKDSYDDLVIFRYEAVLP